MYRKLFGCDQPPGTHEYSDAELVKLALIKTKLGKRKIVCNITTIPPRFPHIQERVSSLNRMLLFDEIVIHVPKTYKRFPENYSLNDIYGATINITECDYGPATRILEGKGDVIVYCDDDTDYSPSFALKLVDAFMNSGEKHCFAGSGFNFASYFMGDFQKTNRMKVQVVEGYGMVILCKDWIEKIRDEFIELQSLTYNDDMILSNLLHKLNIEKYVITGDLNQLEYGFKQDALHYNNGEKTHVLNNKRILKTFREHGKMYFESNISYAIGACNEHVELDNLLWTLVDAMIHCDEIVILVDSTKKTKELTNVLEKYKNFIRVFEREFDGHFANHKNFLNSKCNGVYIFNIDADEIPGFGIMKNMYHIIQKGADLIAVPRVNMLPGASEEFIQKCKFSLNNAGYINWPDMQGRIYRNTPTIKWVNKIHEKIEGVKNVMQLPDDPFMSLWHIKSVQKMKAQDEYYQTLTSSSQDS